MKSLTTAAITSFQLGLVNSRVAAQCFVSTKGRSLLQLFSQVE